MTEAMFVLASADSAMLDRWRAGFDDGAALVEVRSLEALPKCLAQLRPPLVLFDTRLARTGIPRAVDQLLDVRRATRIIAFSDERDEEFELALFLAGVRGLCPLDVSPLYCNKPWRQWCRGNSGSAARWCQSWSTALSRNAKTLRPGRPDVLPS
jgi:DNA-binding NarL/FixJ family response regulator